MDTELTNYLRKVIDPHASVHKNNVRPNLPIYLGEKYIFMFGRILDQQVICIHEKTTNSSINTINKDIKAIKKGYPVPVIFVYYTLSPYRAMKLIEESIPYIELNRRVYLPFVATVYEDKRNRHRFVNIQQFSPSTQAVFLYLLYNNHQTTIYQIAEYFSYSVMTVSRALSILFNLGLVIFNVKGKTGRAKLYKRIDDPDYYKKGQIYLVNPIQYTCYSSSTKPVPNSLDAGLSALSELTMLHPPNHRIVAVSPTYQLPVVTQPLDGVYEHQMEIQIWKYDPKKLSDKKTVDPVSLILSLKEDNDERTEKEVNNLMRSNAWYTE